jgi:signal transduction histidine kinase
MDRARLEQLLSTGRALLSELDPDMVFERILETARELTGARYAAIGVLDESRERLEKFVTSGIDAEARRRIGDPPSGRGVLGVLITDPKPLRLEDVGSHPRSYGFPLGHPRMTTFLGVPILIRGEPWGNLYLAEKEGGSFDQDDEDAIVALAAYAAVAVENARLYRAERARRAELELAVRSFRATVDLARALSGEIKLGPMLELIVKRARDLVSARSVVLELLEEDELVVVKAAGAIRSEVVGSRVPVLDSIGGEVIRQRRPMRIPDVGDRVPFEIDDTTDRHEALFVPLMYRGRALGVLAAFDSVRDDAEFGPDDMALLEAFAGGAASAVATAQQVASEALRRAIQASEQERRRWARELHDEVLQELLAVKLLLSRGQQQEDPQALEEAVKDAIQRLSDHVEVVRSMITDLRPAALDRLGVVAAVEALAVRLQRQSGLQIILTTQPEGEEPRLDADLEAAVYRLIQEGITNAIKHANASRVEVHLSFQERAVSLRVTDDGDGFDVDNADRGFGLLGMRERVQLLGGELDIASAPGSGTSVMATLPVEESERPPAVDQRPVG